VGGVISPLLANILLNKLDRFVEDTLIPQYTKGDKRRPNPEYNKLMLKAWRCRKKGNNERAQIFKKQAQRIPSRDANDPDYRRLKYVRRRTAATDQPVDCLLQARKWFPKWGQGPISLLTFFTETSL